MEKVSRKQVVAFRQDIRQLLERRVLQAVESVLEEELSLALCTGRYERSPVRGGYRHGTQARRITTREGTRELRVPRGVMAPVEHDGCLLLR